DRRHRPMGPDDEARDRARSEKALTKADALRMVARYLTPSSRGPGHRPFTPATRVRIPLGSPIFPVSSVGCERCSKHCSKCRRGFRRLRRRHARLKLRDLSAERGPRIARVHADDVAAWSVRDGFEYVAPCAIDERECDERTAQVVT